MRHPHHAVEAALLQVMTCAVSSGEDVVLKKMLYLYITTYAQHNPDLTLLTINLLTKDCKDQDPTIRGLALRSLCQLRVANLVEYIVSSPPRSCCMAQHLYHQCWQLQQCTLSILLRQGRTPHECMSAEQAN